MRFKIGTDFYANDARHVVIQMREYANGSRITSESQRRILSYKLRPGEDMNFRNFKWYVLNAIVERIIND